ncbi:hypothetical protein MSKU9_2300 [Komagataeibacter diospyri]|uniref:Uncharacterized protein n=2 Tax=Komagataeibacter TaxID=1434011 RepID=A0A0N1FDE2_9PROT|nr:hypothetical protein GLUCOINTEAF2_0203875 [Komagataeibacter intermedius AF2]GCE84159.1 hypothetical protein MSKU9_2300 [Komagataeibacter diospyri]
MLAGPRYRSKNMIRVSVRNQHDVYFRSFHSCIGQMFYERSRTWTKTVTASIVDKNLLPITFYKQRIDMRVCNVRGHEFLA